MLNAPISKLEFAKPQLDALLSPCAYVFYCGEQCLYVGVGYAADRPLQPGHHYRKELACADRLVIYRFRTRREAFVEEKRLIQTLRPRLNKANRWVPKDSKLARARAKLCA